MPDVNIDVGDIIARCAIKQMVGTVDGYRPFAVTNSTPKKFEGRMLKLSNSLADALEVDIGGWEWSDAKKGEQVTNKLKKFYEVENTPAEVDPIDLFVVCVDMLLSFPHAGGRTIKEPPLLLEEAVEHLKMRDSSAGYDPPGNPGGHNKRENALFALSCYDKVRRGHSLGAPFVYAVQSKGNEFLPKEKDQRKIFCESTTQNVFLQMCFGGLIYQPRNIFGGSAQQLSQGGNTGIQMVMKLTPDLPWGEPGAKNLAAAKEILEADDSIAESDKSQWEYRVDLSLKVAFCMVLVQRVDWTRDMLALLPAKLALSAFLVPLVAMNGRHVIIAPNFMPSGSLMTLFGNTEMHRSLLYFYKHKRLRETPEDEKQVLDWLESSVVQGDDFISRNVRSVSAEFDEWCDAFFGTKTKSVTGNCYTTRFLQRSIRWIDTAKCPLPILGYDSERAKKKMCAPRVDEGTMAESIKSIVLSTGDTELAAKVRPFVEDLTTVSKHVVNPQATGATVDMAVLDRGVLQRVYLPTHAVKRDTIDSLRLQRSHGMHPDYHDSLRKRH
jgi:hypothetical protein